MGHWKFLIGQRVIVKSFIDPSSSGDAAAKTQTMDPRTISALLGPEMNVRGKEGTVVAYVQPVWDQHISEGYPSLNQYEIDVDNIGARLVLEPWLDSKPGGL